MDLGGLFATAGIAVAVYLSVCAAIVVLVIWGTYTLIWRAVKRGMTEFYARQLDVDRIPRGPGPRDW